MNDGRFQKQFGEQNPEERQKRKKKLVGLNFTQLALCLAMVIIGVQYNDQEDCRSGDSMHAPQYLLYGGGIVLVMTILNLVAYLTPCQWDDKIVDILEPIADFTGLVVTIWGSVVIFGNSHCLKITQNVAFEFCHFPPIFVLLKVTCLVTLFDRKLQVLKNPPK